MLKRSLVALVAVVALAGSWVWIAGRSARAARPMTLALGASQDPVVERKVEPPPAESPAEIALPSEAPPVPLPSTTTYQVPEPAREPAVQPPPTPRYSPQGLNLDDPMATVDSFLQRNRKEADDAIKALSDEAEALRNRLQNVEAALARWQAVAGALNQEASAVKPAPLPSPGGRFHWRQPDLRPSEPRPQQADNVPPPKEPGPAAPGSPLDLPQSSTPATRPSEPTNLPEPDPLTPPTTDRRPSEVPLPLPPATPNPDSPPEPK